VQFNYVTGSEFIRTEFAAEYLQFLTFIVLF